MYLDWIKPIAPLLIVLWFYIRATKRDEAERPLPKTRLLVVANTLITCFFGYTYAIGNHPASFALTTVGLLASSVAFFAMRRWAKPNHRLIALSEILFLTPLSLTMLLL